MAASWPGDSRARRDWMLELGAWGSSARCWWGDIAQRYTAGQTCNLTLSMDYRKLISCVSYQLGHPDHSERQSAHKVGTFTVRSQKGCKVTGPLPQMSAGVTPSSTNIQCVAQLNSLHDSLLITPVMLLIPASSALHSSLAVCVIAVTPADMTATGL